MKPDAQPARDRALEEKAKDVARLIWRRDGNCRHLPHALRCVECDAETVLDALVSVAAEARREEAEEWRARIRSEHFRECHCRGASTGQDSRSAGQEHWGDCGQAVRERLLAGFIAPEVKP